MNTLLQRTTSQFAEWRSAVGEHLQPYWFRWQRFSESRPLLAKWIQWAVLLTTGLLAGFWMYIMVISATSPSLRELRALQTQGASEIYSADSVLIGRYFDQYRLLVTYDSIPEFIINALVATEDERFYDHSGIDYRSWGRVMFRTILQGDRSGGGGSTISQQLAKNILSREENSAVSLLVHKTREIITAKRLERIYSKEQILALYLNTVTFPDNMYGIDVAAKRFFSKSATELKPEEGALLIGSLKATTYYHPLRHPERAINRRNVVFQQMARNNYITDEVRDSLMALPIDLAYNQEVRNLGIAPHFREYVKREVEELLAGLEKENGQPYDLYTDGLKIYTTLHSGLQHAAEDAIRTHLTEVQREFDRHWPGNSAPWYDETTLNLAMKNSLYYQHLKAQKLTEAEILEKFNTRDSVTIFTWDGPQEVVMSPMDVIKYHLGVLQVGFLSMEPQTGFIRAWVGSSDYDFFQYDHVRSKRQSGSVFKPVVYTQALRSGIEPCEQIENRLEIFHEYAKHDWAIKDYNREDPDPHIDVNGADLDDWIPQNADGKYGGSYSMQGAITHSVNTATVDLIFRTGVDSVIQLAHDMGITGEIPEEPSIALGAASMSLYDMTQVFATLANQGVKVRPKSISHILTHEGEVLVDFRRVEKGQQVVDTTTATIMTHFLESVATMGTASRLRWRYGLYNYPIAGKTGTSQNHADGWFIGYNPHLVSGVWVGGDSPLVRFRNFENGQGAASALPIWAYYMKEVLKKPGFEAWQDGEFPELTPAQKRLLACPMRIKSPEELLADSLAQIQDSIQALQLDSLQVLPRPLTD
ncbi:MAG: transglycosylase domain-containing protein [Saprospiraceae bacterium]|nr:transglycosylase domain-containing protein [Lewinella sp.]